MEYKESERVELKREITDEIKKEIVAFLNTSGGTIYVGVADDGSIYYDLSPKARDIEQTRIINWLINDVITPNPKEYVDLSWNKDGVLVINVAEGLDKPYYVTNLGLKKGCYIRYETSKVEAEQSDIKTMEMASHKLFFEDELSSEQDLNFTYLLAKYPSLVERFFALGFRHQNKYTNLAYLLSDEQSNRTKIYLIDDNNNIKKRFDFKGSILKQIEEILAYFKNLVGYPYEALQEALLNAFTHRNWSSKTNIRIEINQNKINFISPGSLYYLSSDDLSSGKTSYRNPKLAKLFKYLGYTKQYTNGLNYIRNLYQKYKKEPLLMATSKLFILSLPKCK